MKPAIIGRSIFLGIFISISLMLSACQDQQTPEPPQPETAGGGRGGQAAMAPAGSQGAPVLYGQDLEILRFGPSGRLNKLSQVVAMFNQPMVKLGDYQNVPEGTLSLDPPISGDCLWLNQYTLAFIPHEALTGSLDLKAKLDPSQLRALSGATVAEGAEIEITLPPLETQYVYKDFNIYDEDQALRPTWRVYFNQPPDKASLTAKAVFAYTQPDGSEKRIPAEAVGDENMSPAFFTLRAKEQLPRNTPYRLLIEPGLKSSAGPKPAGEIQIGFDSTYGPFKASVENPDGKPFRPNQGIYINFSNPVDFSEILPLLQIDNGYDLKPLRDYYAEMGPKGDEAQAETEGDGFEDIDNIGSSLYIGGPFKAESQYTISIDGQAKDIFGQSLTENFVYSLKTGRHPPLLSLGNNYGLMETGTAPIIKMVASNLKEARLKGYALSAEEAISLLGATDFYPKYYYYENFNKGNPVLAEMEARELTVPIPEAAKDGRVRVPVELKKIFGDDLMGNLLLVNSFWIDDRGKPRNTFALAQISDIGLAVKVGPASSLIWATNISAGRPWAGVELEIRGPEGELLWQGQSDENGLARLPGTTTLLKKTQARAGRAQPGIFVVARSGGQMSLWNARWENGLENWRWNLNTGDAMGLEGEERHLLVSALPLYKPGEKARFKIISRSAKNDRLEDFEGSKIHLEISDPTGQVQATAELEVNTFGTSSYELDIPADASLGNWQVRAGQSGGKLSYAGGFLVQTYRPPAFDISFENFALEALAGSDITIEAKADYHFGAPVAKQPARYSVTASPASFSLPGAFSSYKVTNSYYPADEVEDSGYGYREPAVTVVSGESRLDDDGRLKFPLSLKPAPGQRPAPRNYSIYLNASDVDQRVVSANNKILVHPADLYVGLASDNFVGKQGQAFPIKFIVADKRGRPAPGRQIKATVYRRSWQNVRRKSAGTAYEYVSRMHDEKVSQHQLTSGALPVALGFVSDAPGYYIVQAEIQDDQKRVNLSSYNFYISGSGPVGWKMDNDDKLTLIPDKTIYQAGETARIMIQSPFDEGMGLLTVERAGVRRSEIFAIDSQTPIVEVPLSEEDSPNVFVSVLLNRGRISDALNEEGVDFGKPSLRMGYAELKVPTHKNLLSVAVKADRPEVGPGREVEIELAVSDSEGRPLAEAEVALIAADAAVLQLAGDDAYYPQRVLHSDQALRVQNADNLVSLIGRQNWGLKGGNPGGGGLMAQAAASAGLGDLRRDFASLAFFAPQVSLDSRGQAKVKIKMPENLSTFKIYAIATGHGLLSGTGESSVLVTRDLLVRPALPGYAQVGDEFAASTVVSNRGRKQGQASVRLSGENFALLEDKAEKTVAIGPGESREVSFRVKAGSAGQAKFQFSVNMGPDKDGAEFTIPLSPASRLLTQASYEHITGGSWKTSLALPEKADLSRGGVELELSPSLAGVMSEPFDWLLKYPHGCVEQSLSQAFGSLTWLELKNKYPADPEREKEARKNVEAMLAKLARWERGGGFTTWPGIYAWNKRSVYLSAYALDFILSAKAAGFKPRDTELVKNIQGFLTAAQDSSWSDWPFWYSQTAVGQSKSYALAQLSRSGENVAAYISIMYKDRAKLGLFELANLAQAVYYQRQPGGEAQSSQIDALIKLMGNNIHLTAGEVQFVENTSNTPETWSNPVLNSALILKTLCQIKPDYDLLPALVRWLAGESRAGHFGSTFNNAQALSALAAYVKIMEADEPNLEVSATLGRRLMAEARFSSFTDPAVRGSAPLDAVPQDNPAVIYNLKGQGQLWAALKLKSAPVEPDLSAATSGGFMLSRAFTILDAEGRGTPGAQTFKRGDLVRVTVTMMVPARRHSVVLEDRVPAGFEPVNFNLRDADLGLLSQVEEGEEDSYYNSWYVHQEIWPDKVAVYADYLVSGVYTFSYLARAVTPGIYLTPGPVAEEMYAPETFGRGEGQSLIIE